MKRKIDPVKKAKGKARYEAKMLTQAFDAHREDLISKYLPRALDAINAYVEIQK